MLDNPRFPVEINTLKLGNCSALSSANHSKQPSPRELAIVESFPARFVPHPCLKDPSFSGGSCLGSARLGHKFFLSFDSNENSNGMNRCVCMCVITIEICHEFVELTRIASQVFCEVLENCVLFKLN